MKTYQVSMSVCNTFSEEEIREFIDNHPTGGGMDYDTAASLMFEIWLQNNNDVLLSHDFEVEEVQS